jgi:hypothetical protein
MTQLTTAERLAKVKTALYGDATPTYNDGQLQIFIDEVIPTIDNFINKDKAFYTYIVDLTDYLTNFSIDEF